jgi:hypothetical protein
MREKIIGNGGWKQCRGKWRGRGFTAEWSHHPRRQNTRAENLIVVLVAPVGKYFQPEAKDAAPS